MQAINRVQGTIVNPQEQRFLDWTCARMPKVVSSDHLTGLGLAGALLVVAGYALSRLDSRFLMLAAFGFLVNWFGDAMDGSLARYRNLSRPRYGYFLDHSVDAASILLMIGGMGLTRCVRLDVALFVVMAYFALAIHVFLKNHVTGTFKLSFMAMGPTELRLALIAITLWMLAAGGTAVHLPGTGVSDYDIALLVIGSVLFTLFVGHTGALILQLRAIEGDGRRPAVPATERRPQLRAHELDGEPRRAAVTGSRGL